MEHVQITATFLLGISIVLSLVIAWCVSEIKRLKDILKIHRNDKLYYMDEEKRLTKENQHLISQVVSLQSMTGANDTYNR